MASRRSQIQMSDDEIREFVASHKTIILTSNGRDGFPHPMPMWFVQEDDGTIRMTTFRKSQKVRNIERDPHVSLLVEDGTLYQELRGVVIESRAELVHDVELALDTMSRAAGGDVPEDPGVLDALRKQAAKRVVIRCKPERVYSWDHGKLGGLY